MLHNLEQFIITRSVHQGMLSKSGKTYKKLLLTYKFDWDASTSKSLIILNWFKLKAQRQISTQNFVAKSIVHVIKHANFQLYSVYSDRGYILTELFRKTYNWRHTYKQTSSNFYTSNNVHLQTNVLRIKIYWDVIT